MSINIDRSIDRSIFIVLIYSLYRFLLPLGLADCASILFGINGAKMDNFLFLNEHCHGIITKF